MSTASHRLISTGSLIKQGAEAKVYVLDQLYPEPQTYNPSGYSSSTLPTTSQAGPSVVLKHRFPKTYRHPSLDASLTRTRLQFEARALARCSRAGVTVPKVLWVDETNGVLGMEKIEGWSIREVLGGGAEGEAQEEDEEEREADAPASTVIEVVEQEESEGMKALKEVGVGKEELMAAIGTALARLHSTTIIHGDLTTSNMMVRLTPNSPGEAYEIVLIDFGLSSTAQYHEHYAVDLYVLERAFASTHPQSESLYAGVLQAYAKGLGEKKWKPIETRLEEVRLRGRKRDMTG